MILVCGGDADPNLHTLSDAAGRLGVKRTELLVGAHSHPEIEWDLERDMLKFNGAIVTFKGAFIRYDVFTNLADGNPMSAHRASGWYTTVEGWIQAHPKVKVFNRSFGGQLVKPHVLHLAKAYGLEIPVTKVTNSIGAMKKWMAKCPLVVKPVMGGDYCQELGPILKATDRRGGAAAIPAIVQERLVPPEVRVYRIGDNFISFTVKADALDYRTVNNCKVERFDGVPKDLLTRLDRLTKFLGLNFCAADFKTSPETGRLVFLEVNSGPMFAGFDTQGKGCLTDAMVRWLS